MTTLSYNTKAFVEPGLFLQRQWQPCTINYTPCGFLIKELVIKGNKTPPLVAKDTHMMLRDTGCLYGRRQIMRLRTLSRGLCMNKSAFTQLFE